MNHFEYGPEGLACEVAPLARIAAEDRLLLDEPLRNAHEALEAAWPAMRERLAAAGDVEGPEKSVFLAAWQAAKESEYVARIQGLPAEAKTAGTAWLSKIVETAGAPA